MRPSVVLLLALLFSLASSPGMGEDAPGRGAGKPEIVRVRAGVGGRYKPGCWTEVEVTLRNADRVKGGELTLTVPDGDGVPSRFSTPLPSPGEDAGAGETSVVSYARFGRVRSELAVELREGEKVTTRKVFEPSDASDYLPAVLSEQELVITVGRASPGVEEAVKLLQQGPGRRTVVVHVEDFGELPAQWYGYEAVDTVVVSTSDPEIYAGLTPTSPRVAALEEWIRLGGRMVLCVGEQAEEVLRHEPESALSQFAPGRLDKMETLRRAGAFELYCGSAVRIPASRRAIQVPYLVDVQGKIEAADGPLPLVIRYARGFGQVVFVAADLDRPPFAEWEDRGLLMGKLLGYPARPIDEADEGTAVMHYGYTDLAGQLRSALDQFPSVWVVPFSLVAGLVVLYILAIGPGDYFLLRKVLRRMQLTWITFPLIVAAFSVAAYVLAHRLKGDQIRVNQVDLVDVDVASGRVRGTAWANVFSPRMGRYELAFQPQLPGGRPAREAAALTAWLGLPGDALGGMNPRTAEPGIWQTHYDFSPRLDALENVPIQIWSTKSLTGRWTARAEAPVKGELIEEDALLRGTITNELAVPLSDCLLAHGTQAYELETVGPGETVQVDSNLRSRELKSLLTGRQIIFVEEKDDYRPQSTPYDQERLDVGYILQVMMFFQEAGGRGYTGLSNRYQGFVDFSHLLKTDRAVLVGRVQADASGAPHHGAELLCNGRPVPAKQVRHATTYRFVFPVKSGEW